MNTGKVIDIENNAALVMTDDFIFQYIRAKSDFEIGQKITFCENDIIRSTRRFPVYAAIAAGLAAVITLAFVLLQLNFWRDDIYAFISVDINPSIELSIDSNDCIKKVKPLNSDARSLLNDINLCKMSVSDAMKTIIDRSEKSGFLKTKGENVVLIASALNKNAKPDDGKKLENVLNSIKKQEEGRKGKDISVKAISVNFEERELSLENNISMGRYAIYSRARENEVNISIEEAKNIDILSLWKDLYQDAENKSVISTATPVITKAGKSLVPTAAVVTPTAVAPTAVTSTAVAPTAATPTAVTSTAVAPTAAAPTAIIPTAFHWNIPAVTYHVNTHVIPMVTPDQRNYTNTPKKYHMVSPIYPVHTMPRFTEKPKIPTPPQVNLLKNPGFEGGSTYFWWIKNNAHWSASKEEKHSGEYSLKLSGNGDLCPVIQFGIWIFPNTDYEFSFYAKCKPDSKVSFSIMEDFGGAPITETCETTANDEWTRYSIRFNSGYYSMVRIHLSDGGGEAYFDDFSLINQIKTSGQ